MGLCCSSRKYNKDEDEKDEIVHLCSKPENDFESITNFSTESSKETSYLKQVYSNASKSQNINTFIQYLKVDMRIEIDHSISLGWISTPRTLSDLAAYQIMFLVSQKKKTLLIHHSNSNAYESLLANFKSIIEYSLQEDNLVKIIKEQLNAFIYRLYDIDLLCKADCFILLIANISEIKEICNLYLQNEESVDFFISYCTYIIANKSIRNSKQHKIICLQVLRKIYSPDKSLRKHFILNNGTGLLNSIFDEAQFEEVYEVFYNIQDLVYVISY